MSKDTLESPHLMTVGTYYMEEELHFEPHLGRAGDNATTMNTTPMNVIAFG